MKYVYLTIKPFTWNSKFSWNKLITDKYVSSEEAMENVYSLFCAGIAHTVLSFGCNRSFQQILVIHLPAHHSIPGKVIKGPQRHVPVCCDRPFSWHFPRLSLQVYSPKHPLQCEEELQLLVWIPLQPCWRENIDMILLLYNTGLERGRAAT